LGGDGEVYIALGESVRLHHWTHPQKEIEFDLSRGTSEVVKLDGPRDQNAVCPGYAATEKQFMGRKQHFAIFKSGNGIVFHAGKKHWQLNDSSVKVKHSRPYPFLSRFCIEVSGHKEYSIIYSHLVRVLFMFIDPTYDKIDQDADFFLEFVAENGTTSEWLKHATEHWCESTIT